MVISDDEAPGDAPSENLPSTEPPPLSEMAPVSSELIEEASPITTIMPPQVVPQKRLASQTISADPVTHTSKSARVNKGKEKSSSFRRSKDDYFTLHLPKSVLEMPTNESSEMMSAMATRDDIFQTRELSVEAVEELMDKRLTQVSNIYSCSFPLFFLLCVYFILLSVPVLGAKQHQERENEGHFL